MRISSSPNQALASLKSASDRSQPGQCGCGPTADSYESARGAQGILAFMMQSLKSGPVALRSYPKAPGVSTAADWPAYARGVEARLVGDPSRQKAISGGGADVWRSGGDVAARAAVGWAMQQNPNVKFDVDSNAFFVTDTKGNRKDVASLDEVKHVIASNGGANNSNGAAMQAVGAFMIARVEKAKRAEGPGETAFAMAFVATEDQASPASARKKPQREGFFTFMNGLLDLLGSLLGLESDRDESGRARR